MKTNLMVTHSNGQYDVTIGDNTIRSLSNLRQFQCADKIGVFISESVLKLKSDYVLQFLPDDKRIYVVGIKDCEENKTYEFAAPYLNELVSMGFTRNSLLIAIGGGVISDFVGFIASIYMRGIPIVNIPTTLLAMADACIGGKAAVNLSLGKNMVGSFYPPIAVFVDTEFLNTLPSRELLNGLTEILKHGILGNPFIIQMFDDNTIDNIFHNETIEELILQSIMFKKVIVERDEKENGLRKILNFGHTVGHALESYTQYKTISHGQAVAFGMLLKIAIMKEIGIVPNDQLEHLAALIKKFNLIGTHLGFDAESILKHMHYDKKNAGQSIQLILFEEMYSPKVMSIDDELILKVLRQFEFKLQQRKKI